MADVTTSNYTLHPGDGWKAIVSGGVATFLRLSYFPHHIPVFLANAASAPSLVPSNGSGTVTFSSGVPTANQTVTVGSETYTFVASRTAAFQVAIGGTNLLTATNFAAAIASDSTLVTGSDASGVVTLTSILAGASYNYALATTGTHVAVSGAAFTGGADVVAGFRMDCGGYHFDGAFGDNLYARIQNNSNGDVKISVWQN